MKELTKTEFDKIPDGAVFQMGLTVDDATGANMTTSGKLLKYVIKKGYADDWAIYVLWDTSSYGFVETNGDKVQDPVNIRNIINCSDEMLNCYRH